MRIGELPYPRIEEEILLEELLDKVEVDLPDYKDFFALTVDSLRNDLSLTRGRPTDFCKITACTSKLDKSMMQGSKEDVGDITYAENGEQAPICSVALSKHKKFNDNRYSRNEFFIQPVFNFKNCPELFDIILKNLPPEEKHQKFPRVNFGWYPQTVVVGKPENDNLNQKLDYHYMKYKMKRKNDPNPTIENQEFTFDKTNSKNRTAIFKPISYPVYGFNDWRKYIHMQIKTPRSSIGYHEYLSISKGHEVTDGDQVWIKVEEIPCIVDRISQALICRVGLISGIQFDNYERKERPVDYQKSNVKHFLDKYMKPQMLQDIQIDLEDLKDLVTKRKKEKEKQELEKKPVTKQDEITKIIEEIKNYMPYYLGSDNIEAKVQEYYNQYKDDLKNATQNGDILYVETKNPKIIYQRLIANLQGILNELKSHYEKVKDSYAMIDILNECLKDNVDSTKDEICDAIYKIKKSAFDFITNQKRKHELQKELNEILTRSIEQIKSHIEELKKNPNTKPKTMDELRVEYAKNIDSFLNKIHNVIQNQDVVNDILNSTKAIIKNQFRESKSNVAREYLESLNRIIAIIKEKGTEEDINRYKHEQRLYYDVGKGIDEIIELLKENIAIAYKIQLDIEQRLIRESEMREYDAEIDIKSIFSDNGQNK